MPLVISCKKYALIPWKKNSLAGSAIPSIEWLALMIVMSGPALKSETSFPAKFISDQKSVSTFIIFVPICNIEERGLSLEGKTHPSPAPIAQ